MMKIGQAIKEINAGKKIKLKTWGEAQLVLESEIATTRTFKMSCGNENPTNCTEVELQSDDWELVND